MAMNALAIVVGIIAVSLFLAGLDLLLRWDEKRRGFDD